MKCRIVKKTLSAYIDKELTAPECLKIEKHLAGCSICRQELNRLARAWEILDIWGGVEAPADFEANFQQKLKMQKIQIQNFIKNIFNIPVVFSMIITLIIGLILGNYLSDAIFFKNINNDRIVGAEIKDIFYLETFDVIPANSIEDVYINLISQNENNNQGRFK